MSERNISLSQIAKELHEEGYEVCSEIQYQRYLKTFFELSGSDIERFRVGKKFLFSKQEAIIYKELIRLIDLDGFMHKLISGNKAKITDYDIVIFYESIEKALINKVQNGVLDNKTVEIFLNVLELSTNYTFTKVVFEIEEKFMALMKITNIYFYQEQNRLLKHLLDEFTPFFDKIYVQAMLDIIKLTEEKIINSSKGTIEEYLDATGRYSYQTALLVSRDKRISEFFEAYPDEKKKIENHLNQKDIAKYFIRND